MMPDAETSAGYFAALQLPPGSSPQQIHAQYRRLAKQYHPDRNPNRREWSEAQLRSLNEAYDALSQVNGKPLTVIKQSPPSPSAVRQETAWQPHPARRFFRYLAVVGLVCGISIAYANWSQSPQISSAGQGTNSTLSPVAPEDVAALPAAQPAPAIPPKDDPVTLAARFSADKLGVDTALAQASRIVGHVNAEMEHAPQSRRPQKAEQLAADMLELSRLQHSLRIGLQEINAPASQDLHRTQIADMQLALSQLEKQQRLVTSEASSFPAK